MAYMSEADRRNVLDRMAIAGRLRTTADVAWEHSIAQDAEDAALHLAANVPSSLFALMQGRGDVKSVF